MKRYQNHRFSQRFPSTYLNQPQLQPGPEFFSQSQYRQSSQVPARNPDLTEIFSTIEENNTETVQQLIQTFSKSHSSETFSILQHLEAKSSDLNKKISLNCKNLNSKLKLLSSSTQNLQLSSKTKQESVLSQFSKVKDKIKSIKSSLIAVNKRAPALSSKSGKKKKL